MSSTYSSGKRVSAMRANNGTILYALHEETCCSNVYPRKPTWSCIAVGKLESVMEVIFRGASYTEGGCLKGANGRPLTPAGYIQGWLKELKAPSHMDDYSIEVYSDNSYRSVISPESLAERASRFEAANMLELQAKLQAGERIKISLSENPVEVDILFGIGQGWNIVTSTDLSRVDIAYEFSYDPAPSKVIDLPAGSALKFTTHDSYKTEYVLNIGADGALTTKGSSHDNYTQYIRNECAKAELKYPNTYRKRFAAFQAMLDNATPISTDSIRVVVDPARLDQWIVSDYTKLKEQLPHVMRDELCCFDFPTEERTLWTFQRLFMASTFEIKTAEESQIDNVAPAPAPTHQLDLWAC